MDLDVFKKSLELNLKIVANELDNCIEREPFDELSHYYFMGIYKCLTEITRVFNEEVDKDD